MPERLYSRPALVAINTKYGSVKYSPDRCTLLPAADWLIVANHAYKHSLVVTTCVLLYELGESLLIFLEEHSLDLGEVNLKCRGRKLLDSNL